MTARAGKPPDGQSPQRKLYGRRKGRPLRPHRQYLVDRLLPRLEISGAAPPQPVAGRPLWIEIGFGAGEHLSWQAEHHPDTDFIGSEVFINGVARLLSDIEERSLGNIRLWTDDARLLLDTLPDGAVDRIFVLFPDPWPKARHRKRRIIGPGTLPDIARVLRPGGILRAATDIPDYQRWMLQHVLGCGAFDWTARRPADWRNRPDDWPETRYEAKAVAAGRPCAYFSFRRNHQETPH